MQVSDIPPRFQIPFADAAGVNFKRVIPVASQIGIHDGWASMADGFPPVNADPVVAGGVPPFMQDMNGILYAVSNYLRWIAAGGREAYDPTFQTAIGGYPYGCMVASATLGGVYWFSNADNNLTNPDAGGANWLAWNTVSGTPNVSRPSLVAGAALANLGFTPVRQNNGGIGMMDNDIRLGYNGTGKTLLQVDNFSFGALALESWVAPQVTAIYTAISNEAAARTLRDNQLIADYANRDNNLTNDYTNRDNNIYTYVNGTFVPINRLPGDFNGTVGWQKFYNGLIIQWGNSVNTDQTPVFFPISFPNGIMSVQVGEYNADGWGGTAQVSMLGSTRANTGAFVVRIVYTHNGGSLSVPTAGVAVSWIAIGW